MKAHRHNALSLRRAMDGQRVFFESGEGPRLEAIDSPADLVRLSKDVADKASTKPLVRVLEGGTNVLLRAQRREDDVYEALFCRMESNNQ